MPLNATTPKTYLQADQVRVIRMVVDAETNTITVQYNLLYQDMIVAAYQEVTVDATPYGSQLPDGARTWYRNLKEMAYRIGQDAGVFPPGIVS